MHARTLITVSITAALLSLCSCGSDQPEPIPKVSTSPTPSVSPPPDAPDLAAKDQEAYQTAVDDFVEVRATLDALYHSPKLTKKTATEVYKHTGNPLSKTVIRNLDAMSKSGQHTTGHGDVAWSVAKSVDLGAKKIVWLQCTITGTFKLINGDGEAEPRDETNGLRKITSERDDGGFWHATGIERAGTC